MDTGNVAEIGSHDELLAKDESIYKSLWNMQVNSRNEIIVKPEDVKTELEG
jgi:hypothetical protein